MNLTIERSAQGEWTVLEVGGELDLHSHPVLRDRLAEEAGIDAKIALDLTDVTFIDSSGLGAIVGAMKQIRERGGTLALVAPNDAPLARMLSLTGLDQLVQPLPDRASLEEAS